MGAARERAAIRTAYAANDFNQFQPAAALGLTRNELRTHLARLGLIKPRR